MMKCKWSCLIALLVLTLPIRLWAATPTETVTGHVDQLLKVLGDPNLSSDQGLAQKKEAVRAVSRELFDFTELSRLSLGAQWKKFDETQRQAFIEEFRILLEGVYMDRLLAYKQEKVNYKKELNTAEGRAEVKTEVAAAGGPILIDYRLILKDGIWRVYDLIIENVSLVKNYRSQFNDILAKDNPGGLLKKLREKNKAKK